MVKGGICTNDCLPRVQGKFEAYACARFAFRMASAGIEVGTEDYEKGHRNHMAVFPSGGKAYRSDRAVYPNGGRVYRSDEAVYPNSGRVYQSDEGVYPNNKGDNKDQTHSTAGHSHRVADTCNKGKH